MPMQDPQVRRGNFTEVALGYTPEQARLEAGRCLQCKNPTCQAGCPVEVDCKAFIHHVAEGRLDEAYKPSKPPTACRCLWPGLSAGKQCELSAS
jgi:sulfide dehydrogenase (flavoprotein) subunit SudA (EC 1.97.-.-)